MAGQVVFHMKLYKADMGDRKMIMREAGKYVMYEVRDNLGNLIEYGKTLKEELKLGTNRERIGRCETCRYARYESGFNEIPDDFECEMWDSPEWDKMVERYGDEYMEMAGSETTQCPLWKPMSYAWCPKHRIWVREDEPCPYCEREVYSNEDFSWEEANGYGKVSK